ncbi:hypothetical protein AVEN_265237-1 [Araneus ventricosus]|uniref:Tc1-like transposase DDE domain-containing protein n=1 Tax=Araneus ventricosus TaxID=182803 RepID=A0A4Y2TP53_ARAVE|nr:hypothetical protein AVEN_265237-1 [Araneus ventricosus]
MCPHLIVYLERDHTVTADRYCDTLARLREVIRLKRPGILNDGVILLNDNARSHTASKTRELLQMFQWESHLHTYQIRHLVTISFFRN